MALIQLAVDESPHNSDGLLLHGCDNARQVTAFISRRVMDDWVDPRQPYGRRTSLFRNNTIYLANTICRPSRVS